MKMPIFLRKVFDVFQIECVVLRLIQLGRFCE